MRQEGKGRAIKAVKPLKREERKSRPRPPSFLLQIKELIKDRAKKHLDELRSSPEHSPPVPKTAAGIVRGIALELVAVSLLLAVIVALFSPMVLDSGYAPGFDTPSHMYITERLAEALKTTGRLPKIDLYWYSGLEITHKLPPLTYIPLVAIYLLTGQAMLTSRIFYVVALVLMGLSMYAAVRLSAKRPAALGAALTVVVSTAGAGWPNGVLISFTRYFAFLLFPWAIHAAKRLADGARPYAVVLAIVLSLMLPSHPMIALLAVVWTFVYVIARLVLARLPLRVLTDLIFAYFLTVFLAAWYLGPFLFEQPVWGTAVPQSILIDNSFSLRDEFSQMGLVFLLLGLGSTLIWYSKDRLAIFIASSFGFLYALGVNGPVLTVFPFLKFAYPFLAFFASVIGFTYLIFTGTWSNLGKAYDPWSWRARLVPAAAVLGIAAVLVSAAYFIGFTTYDTSKFTKEELAAAGYLRRQRIVGRVMPLGPPYGLIVHAIALKAKKQSAEGQYTTISPFYLQITQVYDDLRKGYLQAGAVKLRRWTANDVLITPYLKQRRDFKKRDFAQVLVQNGYRKVYENPAYELYRRRRPYSYVQPVAADVLVIGRFAPILEALYPNSLAAQRSDFADQFNLKDLEQFRAVALYGFKFENRGRVDSTLEAYVRRGGRALVDLQAADEFSLLRNEQLLGVDRGRVTLSGKVELRSVGDRTPKLKPIVVGKKWQTVYYKNLDKVLVYAVDGHRRFPVVGYKKLGRGRVYFFGANLLFYAFDKRRADISDLLRTALGGAGERKIEIKDIRIKRFTPQTMVFSYRAAKRAPILVSRTYSPHWRAKLDGGRALRIDKTEGLMSLTVPAGSHRVSLRYGADPVHPISWLVTGLACLYALYLIVRGRHEFRQP